MSIVKKYKILWSVLIVILGLNVWLLYGKVNLQQRMDTLQAEILQKEGSVSRFSQPVTFTSNYSFMNNPIGLVAIFTDYGCTSCVIAEIKYLNEWKQKFNNTLQVYYIGESEDYLEQFGAKFTYTKIETTGDLFSVPLPIGNPIVVMIDKNHNVHAIHTNDLSRPGSEQRRTNFYKRVNSLFIAVYGD